MYGDDDERLPTHVTVSAVIRRAATDGGAAYVLHKGDAERGMVLVKLIGRDRSCRLQLQQRDLDGRLQWMSAFRDELVPEAEADAYIARNHARDPDVWAVAGEVIAAASPNPFTLQD